MGESVYVWASELVRLSTSEADDLLRRQHEMLKRLEFSDCDAGGNPECHICQWLQEEHAPDCPLAALLREVEG